jgi:hypothetical protein
MPMTTECIAFWNMPRLLKYYRRVTGIFYLHFQGIIITITFYINSLLISEISAIRLRIKSKFSESIYSVSAVKLAKQSGL